jgi:hypothetical protein
MAAVNNPWAMANTATFERLDDFSGAGTSSDDFDVLIAPASSQEDLR